MGSACFHHFHILQIRNSSWLGSFRLVGKYRHDQALTISPHIQSLRAITTTHIANRENTLHSRGNIHLCELGYKLASCSTLTLQIGPSSIYIAVRIKSKNVLLSNSQIFHLKGEQIDQLRIRNNTANIHERDRGLLLDGLGLSQYIKSPHVPVPFTITTHAGIASSKYASNITRDIRIFYHCTILQIIIISLSIHVSTPDTASWESIPMNCYLHPTDVYTSGYSFLPTVYCLPSHTLEVRVREPRHGGLQSPTASQQHSSHGKPIFERYLYHPHCSSLATSWACSPYGPTLPGNYLPIHTNAHCM